MGLTLRISCRSSKSTKEVSVEKLQVQLVEVLREISISGSVSSGPFLGGRDRRLGGPGPRGSLCWTRTSPRLPRSALRCGSGGGRKESGAGGREGLRRSSTDGGRRMGFSMDLGSSHVMSIVVFRSFEKTSMGGAKQLCNCVHQGRHVRRALRLCILCAFQTLGDVFRFMSILSQTESNIYKQKKHFLRLSLPEGALAGVASSDLRQKRESMEGALETPIFLGMKSQKATCLTCWGLLKWSSMIWIGSLQ